MVLQFFFYLFFLGGGGVGIYMRIVCQQTILMKYNALFEIFEKIAKFAIVLCCKL